MLAADAGVHAMTEAVNVTAGPGAEFGSATLGFTDVDLKDAHTVGAALLSSSWSNGEARPPRRRRWPMR